MVSSVNLYLLLQEENPLVFIYCSDRYAVDPTVCDHDQDARNLWVLEDTEDIDDEMETTFTTFTPCDGMDATGPLHESGGSESFANPLYETADVSGKLAVWKHTNDY